MFVDIFSSYISTTLVFLVVFLVIWMWNRRPAKIPPGPTPVLPVIGNLLSLRGDTLSIFRQMRKDYGDIFSVYMGNRLVIVMNGFDVLKEAFIKNGEVFSDRPHMFIVDQIGHGKGIANSSGEMWREQRKFGLATLREFGFGRTILEDKVNEEVSAFLNAVVEKKEQPFDMRNLIHTSISNTVCSIVFGKRFENDDPNFVRFLQALDENFKTISGTAALNYFPILQYLPGDPFFFRRTLRNVAIVENELIDPAIDDHIRHFQNDKIDDFVSAYIKEMKEKERSGERTTINRESLERVIADLFVAGTETTGTTLRWAVIYLLHHPDVQEKCFAEITEKVGTARMPSMKDRQELPYVEATIMEVQRCGNIAPLSLGHAVSHDVTFRGFTFPKDAILLPNIDSVLMDASIWKDPDVFRPERFLNETGHVCKPEQFIPFSLGRRVCLGEALAKMELFLFLSSMIQRFKFVPVKGGDLPSLKGNLGLSLSPNPFDFRALIR